MFTIKEVEVAINRMANSGLINSGALVELDPEELTIEVVFSHGKYVESAPRIYGEFTHRDAQDAWLSWTASVLDILHGMPMTNKASWRKSLARKIRDRVNQLLLEE